MIDERPPAGVRAAGRHGRLRAARHDDPAAEPGRVVHLHHRPRPGRARHLRLRPSRSEDDAAVSVDDADRGRVARRIGLGRWQLPLSSGRVELLRRGQPFWEVLEARGVPTTIIRMPANFPPSGTATRELSGMGTPDLLGTYGTFALLHLRAVCLRRTDAVRRRGAPGAACATASCTRRSKGPTTRSFAAAGEGAAPSSPRMSIGPTGTSSWSSAARSACSRSASGATGCR